MPIKMEIILTSFIILATHAQDDIHPYESVENACDKCTCTQKEGNQPAKLYVLNCTWKNFSQIFADYPTEFDLSDKATQLDLSFAGNNITFLNQLPATGALVYFSCRHCGIQEISAEVFIDVPLIYKVDLSWNKLNDLLPEIFKGRYNTDVYELIGLVELDLSHNLLETLEHLLFEHVQGLKVLNLAHNQLNLEHPSTKAALASLKNLEKLNLANTGIDTLPAEVINDRLIELNIYGNRFLTVPNSLAHAGRSLRRLNIGGNPISEINDGNFTAMNSLKSLQMSDMQSLEIIQPKSFLHLNSLESFVCSNNTNLTSIDIGSLNYTTLRTLDISSCSLKTLNATYYNADQPGANDTIPLLFSNLRTLKLDNNPWHCDCSLFKSLQILFKFDENDFQSEHVARCSTPYELTSDLLVDITINKLCLMSNNKKPRQPVYDPPPFLRPRSILFSLLSILIVVLIGLCIGFAIVLIKKKLKQNEKRKLTTIIAILKSRRLLSDHSEVLEECLSIDCNIADKSSLEKYLNGIGCSLLITSSIVMTKFLSKRIGLTMCAISSGCTIICLSKLVLYGQLWILHKSIVALLNDIDEFDACMRRSMSYFRENAFFETAHQSSADKVSTTSKDIAACTESLIRVIESVRDVVVCLEKTTVPSKISDSFNSLEELTELLQKSRSDPTVSSLKDLYNIFLYVQSHLLTRFSLFLMYNTSQSHLLPKTKSAFLSRVIKAEIRRENSRYEQLTSSATMTSDHLHTIDHITTEPISNLKSYSISASSKILAIANECRRIDDIVQSVHQLNRDELTVLMPSITQIENAFLVCQSEYQRFVVAYFKAMNINYNDHCGNGQAGNGENEFTADNESLQLKFKEIQPDEEEFFTSTERTSDDESKESISNRRCWDDELAEKNVKVVKQRFKPVLAQLKGKIEPIAVSLRERERNHLLSKGIDPNEFVDCIKINEGFKSCSDSEDEDFERHKKPNRFDDMRKFLEGKSQISFIPMRSANDSFLNEDILE